MGRLRLQQLGDICANESCLSPGRILQGPGDDNQLQAVLRELSGARLASGFTEAIGASIDYVLDGARTGRYDLQSPEVHPGERASVGAKLEYEAQRVFGWKKAKPLDIQIAGTPLDLKCTIGDNWAIPSEAHCQLCICTQIGLRKNQHRSWLVRTHTSWLYRGDGNKDGKRGLAVHARDYWSVPLYDWTDLPVNPLTLLTKAQAEKVLAEKPGQQVRLLALFGYLPRTVIPRSAIETVCAGKQDPIRRLRNIRKEARKQGLLLLCGKGLEQRATAARYGFALGPGDWVAIPLDQVKPSSAIQHDQAWPTEEQPALWGDTDAEQ